MDGLASGVAVIVLGMYLAIALDSFYAAGTQTRLSWFGLLAAGLIGANLGFLIYNFKPAKVFMAIQAVFFSDSCCPRWALWASGTRSPL